MRTPLYWIEGPWTGRLGTMPRPRGGDWLQEEVEGWRSNGVQVVVSALEKEEIIELELQGEENHCRALGLEFHNFPIPDRSVPAGILSTVDFLQPRLAQLAEGKSVAIHCRAGIGRSSLLAACLLAFGKATRTRWPAATLEVKYWSDNSSLSSMCPTAATDKS